MKKKEFLDEEIAVIESVLIHLYNKIEKNNQTIRRINRLTRNRTRYNNESSRIEDDFTIQTCEDEIKAIRGAMHGIRSLTEKTKTL